MNQKKFHSIIQKWSGESCPVEEHWRVVCDILLQMGFKKTISKGSHFSFFHPLLKSHPDCFSGIIQIPTIKGKYVKKVYLNKILKYYTFLISNGAVFFEGADNETNNS